MCINVEGRGQKVKDPFIIPAINLGIYDGPLTDSVQYYGLFLIKHIIGKQYFFKVKKINTSDYLKRIRQLDYHKVRSDSLIFVFSGIEFQQTEVVGWVPDDKYKNLYPGQSFLFSLGHGETRHSYHFYAKGDIINSVDTTSLEVFDGIENYQLRIRLQKEAKIYDQQIFSRKIERWMVGDYLGGFFNNWIGDLNGDGMLDMLSSNIAHHECFDIEFRVSTNEDSDGQILKTIVKYTLCGS